MKARLVVAIGAALAAATGGAGRAGADEAPQSAPSAGDQSAAREHFSRGNAYFNVGSYDQAIAEFKQAYLLSNAPGLLYNIAQAYRLERDYPQALRFYRTYLRLVPDAPNRAKVEARIADLEPLVPREEQAAASREASVGSAASRPAPASTVAPGPPASTVTIPTGAPALAASMPAASTPVVASGVPAPSRPIAEPAGAEPPVLQPSPTRLPGAAVSGAGVVLLVTATVFAIEARSASASITTDAAAGTHVWDSGEAARYTAGERDQEVAAILGVAGGVAIASGAALYYLEGHREGQPRVAASLGAGGFDVALSQSF